jgi:glycosyltransferase involved in cell wall biosynthesis
MLGWEFPPVVSGGLGVACYGLAKALNSQGIDVLFLLPKPRAGHGSRSAFQGGAGPGDAGHAGPGRSSGEIREIKKLPAASAEEVHQAVEQAEAHANGVRGVHEGAGGAGEGQGDSWRGVAPEGSGTSAGEQGDGEESLSTEEVHLQRVTFVPVDVWLTPYMTPQQYQRMVVEEMQGTVPGGSGQARGDRRWVERAVAAPFGPAAQPPNRPYSGEGQNVFRAGAIPTPPPLAPFHARRDAQEQRGYIEAPAGFDASRSLYGADLFAETERYARLALAVARSETFDVVHAHDWMTFEGALAVAAATQRPLVVQIHSTELDRAGARATPRIMEIERQGMLAADLIVAVSYRTKTQLIEKYGIDPRKIEVVYNATDAPTAAAPSNGHAPAGTGTRRTVLFLGRLTQQKGPAYFLHAAKKVLSIEPDVQFILAGKGDLRHELEQLSAELQIADRVVFAGFLSKGRARRILQAADVYVMPSMSEPFGIAPLEALAQEVPVIISKQSGVAEVLRHVLKVDFWDTDDLANKILAVLRHPPLAQTLREHGQKEVRQLSWEESARQVIEHYQKLAASSAAGSIDAAPAPVGMTEAAAGGSVGAAPSSGEPAGAAAAKGSADDAAGRAKPRRRKSLRK